MNELANLGLQAEAKGLIVVAVFCLILSLRILYDFFIVLIIVLIHLILLRLLVITWYIRSGDVPVNIISRHGLISKALIVLEELTSKWLLLLLTCQRHEGLG